MSGSHDSMHDAGEHRVDMVHEYVGAHDKEVTDEGGVPSVSTGPSVSIIDRAKDELKERLRTLLRISPKPSTNGHIVRPLITAKEAEIKIEEYTAQLISSIEMANKQYVIDNPGGTYPIIGDVERLLIRSKVSQTVRKCFSVAPDTVVKKTRQRKT